MAYSAEAIDLRIPETVDLARVEDRITYLFLDRVRIEQGRTGIEAWGTNPEDEFGRTAIPCASLAVLALGPGSSITTPALTTLHRSGTTVLITSADGLVSYTASRPLTETGKWAQAQATLWANPETRLTVAHEMYNLRFGEKTPSNVPLATLRGLEGQRVKSTYKILAARHKTGTFYRNTTDPRDAVNQNLNLGNAILYGLALSVCHALALNPALGFIHHGRPNSLLYDLADIYKLETTVPLAFEYGNPKKYYPQTYGTALRAAFHEKRVLKNMMQMTLDLLRPGLPEESGEDLLFSDTGYAQGMKNWAEEQ